MASVPTQLAERSRLRLSGPSTSLGLFDELLNLYAQEQIDQINYRPLRGWVQFLTGGTAREPPRQGHGSLVDR